MEIQTNSLIIVISDGGPANERADKLQRNFSSAGGGLRVGGGVDLT